MKPPLPIGSARNLRPYLLRSWQVSWPMTLIMCFEFLIGLTDVYIAGRLGQEVQATYGFVIQLYFIFIVAANALTGGTVALVARLFTAGDRNELAEAIFSSLAATLMAGTALAAAGIFFAPQLIHLLNLPPALKQFSDPLFKIYSAGLLFHYLLINTNGILRSSNRVKTSLKTMALVCFLNVLLNFMIVFHTPLGFRGIALSTALSVFIGALVNLALLHREWREVKRISLPKIQRIAHIGWPMGLLQILWQLASMVLFLILSALPEKRVEVLAALTAGLRIESAIFLPAFAFNLANAVVVGNLMGGKKPEEAFHSGLATAVLGVILVSVLAVLVVANAWWIAFFLSDNDVVRQESVKYLYISMISEPFMAWAAILGGGLNGAGDTRSVLLRSALSLWLVRIPLSYMFVILLGFGATSVWWSMNASQFVQALLISRRYFSRDWLTRP